MIKLKVGNLVGAFQSGALSRLASSNLPIKTAGTLKKILDQSQEAIKKYESDRVEVCKKFGTLDEATNNYQFLTEEGELDEEKFASFQKEADALLQVELTFDGHPFTISQFYSTHAITANDLMVLDWLIVLETDVQTSAASN